MDNITHSLVGMLIAEQASRFVPGASFRQAGRAGTATHDAAEPASSYAPRSACYVASLLANNFPDLDFLYAGITEGKLGYLLHHRGHTHTLIGAVLGALVAWALTLAALCWMRRKKAAAPLRGEALFLLGLCCLGTLLHIGMDYANNYGVHPFWPVDSRWFYGDTLFIIEPLLWSVLLPPLVQAARGRWVKGLLLSILAVGLGLCFIVDLVPMPAALGATFVALVSGWVCFRLGPGRRVLSAVFGFVLVTATFWLAKTQAQRFARAALASAAAGESTLDLIVTPLPGTPWCWTVLALQVSADHYVVRAGRVSAVPAWIEASECPGAQMLLNTAPSRSLGSVTPRSAAFAPAAFAPAVFDREYTAPLAELAKLLTERCEVRAFLRFARAPFFAKDAEQHMLLGDARYDREAELGFSELRLGLSPACPRFVPGWLPPRQDLLEILSPKLERPPPLPASTR